MRAFGVKTKLQPRGERFFFPDPACPRFREIHGAKTSGPAGVGGADKEAGAPLEMRRKWCGGGGPGGGAYVGLVGWAFGGGRRPAGPGPEGAFSSAAVLGRLGATIIRWGGGNRKTPARVREKLASVPPPGATAPRSIDPFFGGGILPPRGSPAPVPCRAGPWVVGGPTNGPPFRTAQKTAIPWGWGGGKAGDPVA